MATQRSNLFIPEVATSVATAVFPDELALRFAGSPMVRAFPAEASLTEGDTVKFPRFDPLTGFAAMAEDVALTPEVLATSTDTAVVQHAGKAAEITDWAQIASKGDPSSEVGRQMARLGAEYTDSALLTEAYTSALTNTPGSIFTYASFISAMFTNWGDKSFSQVGGLIVHSKVMGDMMVAAEFKTVDQAGPLASNVNGLIGHLAGIPVFMSDRITVDTVPIPDEYDCLLVKAGGLGLQFQRDLLVETDRDILSKNTVIAGDILFAVHLFYDNPSPVLKIHWQ